MTDTKTSAEVAVDLQNRLAYEIDRFKTKISLYATNPKDPSHQLSFRMKIEEAEFVIATLALRSFPQAGAGMREALISPAASRADLIAMIQHRDALISDLKAALASPAATPDREKIARQLKISFIEHSMHHPVAQLRIEYLFPIMADAILALFAQQPVATEREAIIEECAKVADNLSDCSGPFIAEQIRALAQQPRSEGRGE